MTVTAAEQAGATVSTGAEPYFRCHGLKAYYGDSYIVQNVSFEIAEGQILALLGRNGAGKTSTLRAIARATEPELRSGEVYLRGEALHGKVNFQAAQAGVQLVQEDRRIIAGLTVMENLKIPRPALKRSAHYWTIDKVFQLFPPLEEFKTRLAGNLSGGQQQMLSIARSLLIDPVLLLLDEPHEGLAPLVAREVVESINELKAAGVSLLVSEQHLKLVHGTADRIYVLDKGMTVFAGTMNEFEQDPEIARKFLMVVQ